MPGWVWTLQQRGHIVVELGGISYWESSKLLPCHTTRDRHDDDDKEYLSQKRERFKIRLHVCFEFQWATITIVSYVFYECSAMKKISGPEKLEPRTSHRSFTKPFHFSLFLMSRNQFNCLPKIMGLVDDGSWLSYWGSLLVIICIFWYLERRWTKSTFTSKLLQNQRCWSV